jgi:gliding motility-associated lipoprotein GldD
MLFFMACREAIVPKPNAFLSLKYPDAFYQKIALNQPFKFDKNKLAVVEGIQYKESSQSLNLNYPLLKAKLYLSYHPLNENLARYVSETEFTTKNHAKVAHQVTEQKFENLRTNVFGKMYELTGPVASQCQFYVTDSSQHFLTGALYFKVKPNYDSILPAVRYLQKDMIRLVESLEWKF